MAGTTSPYTPIVGNPADKTSTRWWNTTKNGLPALTASKPRPAAYADYSESAWLALCNN